MEKYVSTKEWMAYAVGALGQGMVYAIMSSYISDFYLSVLKLTPIFVLLLMLLARIWDAINDPIMGYIVDRSSFKNGKMRPYLIFTPIPIAILTVLLFYAPNLSGWQLMLYAGITYVAWGMVYTASDVPFWSMPNVMTPNPDERGNIISNARTANGIGSAVPMAIFMLLGFILPRFNLSGTELEKTKYMTIALICAVLGNVLFIRVYFKAKERVNIPVPSKKKKGEASALKLILSCKPLILTALMGILSSARYMYQAGAVHVARYSFYIGKDLTGLSLAEQEEALQSNISLVSTVFAVATALGMFGAMLVMPLLFKKFNYKQIIIGTSLIGFVASMAIWFIGYEHFWACVPFLVLSCIPCGAINICAFAMVGDCLDYMEWKTGERNEGVSFSVLTFLGKLTGSVSTSIGTALLPLIGLSFVQISSTETKTIMGDNTDLWIWALYILVPHILGLISVIPYLFYDLRGEKLAQIRADLKERRENLSKEVSQEVDENE